MRYLILIIVIFALYKNADAQNSIKLKVPEIVVDKKIDSLLDRFISYAPKDSSCIISIKTMHSPKNDFTFSVEGLETELAKMKFDVMYDDTSLNYIYKVHLRYFKYRGVLVFVSGPKAYGDRFQKKTGLTQTFSFYNTSNNNVDKKSSYNSFDFGVFHFKNGRIVSVFDKLMN